CAPAGASWPGTAGPPGTSWPGKAGPVIPPVGKTWVAGPCAASGAAGKTAVSWWVGLPGKELRGRAWRTAGAGGESWNGRPDGLAAGGAGAAGPPAGAPPG